MGYRAQVVTQHREYGSSIFWDFTQFEDYFNSLRDRYPDDELFQSESQDFFEISKDVVEKEIKRLRELGEDEDFEFQSGWSSSGKDSNGIVAGAWKLALSSSPEDSEYVSLEWY